jgi:hypothetical protein
MSELAWLAKKKIGIKVYILTGTIIKILAACVFAGASAFFFCGDKLIKQLNEQSKNTYTAEHDVMDDPDIYLDIAK